MIYILRLIRDVLRSMLYKYDINIVMTMKSYEHRVWTNYIQDSFYTHTKKNVYIIIFYIMLRINPPDTGSMVMN